ncbi:hypothetical protein FDA94_15450 [Herbidospora galbida]|uniref:Metalloprotease-like protein n=1 Tax=Herbidospora galbida TaxID=2575442 RepID=A0A4U3MFA6_9ACTN|nr:hypothetical protein [Herbidospora galbida]TKK87955.1 hypothetical protein FDA94_15450 [Herbidospora galbida]
MRLSLITGLLVALMATVVPGPAYADPVDHPMLSGNDLYDSGVIPRSTCPERPIGRRNDAALAKRYVTTVVSCLNRVWSAQFAKAGLKFRKPEVALLTKNPKRSCGLPWHKYQFLQYCADDVKIVVVLDWKLLRKDPDDLYIFTMMSNLYAWHINWIVGIEPALLDEQEPIPDVEITRRNSLQEYCLSGAFIGSVYRSMRHRDAADWKDVLRQLGRLEAGAYTGTGKNIAYWMNRGFTTRDVGTCAEAWTAPASKVA